MSTSAAIEINSTNSNLSVVLLLFCSSLSRRERVIIVEIMQLSFNYEMTSAAGIRTAVRDDSTQPNAARLAFHWILRRRASIIFAHARCSRLMTRNNAQGHFNSTVLSSFFFFFFLNSGTNTFLASHRIEHNLWKVLEYVLRINVFFTRLVYTNLRSCWPSSRQFRVETRSQISTGHGRCLIILLPSTFVTVASHKRIIYKSLQSRLKIVILNLTVLQGKIHRL